MIKQGLPFILSIMLLVSCNGKQEVFFYSNSYAEGFSIEKHEGYTLVHIRYPGESKTLQSYILIPKQEEIPDSLPEGIIVRTPLERVISFSSVTCGIIDEIGEINSIIGLTESQYTNIAAVKENVTSGKIIDLGLASNPDIEKILLLEPEAIFFNPISGQEISSLQKLRFPIFQCVDYKETSPLGQTEWIRLIGLLYDKEELADSLFKATEESYLSLVDLTKQIDTRPCVFSELKYGDFWHVPGGKSYLANLFQDAGADYRWKEDSHSGSISLSFEQVLDQAEDCNFWLIKYFNPIQEMTLQQLAAEYKNYTLFGAYKNRNIFACNTANVPYYEELPLHPDWLLKDLIHIFHPELLPNHTLRYYKRVEN